MLEFKEISIDDKQKFIAFANQTNSIMSDRTFATMFAWGKHLQIQLCFYDKHMFMCSFADKNMLKYYMPLGGEDIFPALEIISSDAFERKKPYKIIMASEQETAMILEHYKEKCVANPLENEFDYIYDAQSLITLSGKHLHAKRNYVNRFISTYEGRWTYTDVDPVSDKDEIFEFLAEWCTERNESKKDCGFEKSAIERLIDNYTSLDLISGIIRIDEKIIALTIATHQNSKVIDIMIEKAETEYEGAYQMINREFALRNFENIEYINREEDMGIETLRQAKLSYYPAFLEKKYEIIFV
ncbi:MAG: phosphatidylglycerol lysyltransferase domain-containing protein [Clostridia bacterium]